MKTLVLAATTAFIMTATTAYAFDIGDTGIQINTDFVAEYTTSTEDFTTTLSPELRYIPLESVSVYVTTDFNLQDPGFNGVTLGAEYAPGVAGLDLVAYGKATSDSDFNFDGAVVGVELKF